MNDKEKVELRRKEAEAQRRGLRWEWIIGLILLAIVAFGALSNSDSEYIPANTGCSRFNESAC